MKYLKQHAGKWVAVSKNKVLAANKEFEPLQKKMASRRDASSVSYTLVPKGMITGAL